MLEIVYLLHKDYGRIEDAVLFFSRAKKLLSSFKENIRFTCLMKGFSTDSVLDDRHGFYTVNVPNVGRDVYSYLYYSQITESDFLIFFNTASALHSSEFILSGYEQLKKDNCGAFAATASYGSIVNSKYFLKQARYSWIRSISNEIPKYALAYAAEVALAVLGYIPVPHLRTNAFGISRLKLNAIISGWNRLPTTRLESLFFESGNRGLSGVLSRASEALIVVDKYGNDFDQRDWLRSKTYCCFAQCCLAVSDNRTDEYDHADSLEKQKLFVGAWCNHDEFDHIFSDEGLLKSVL